MLASSSCLRETVGTLIRHRDDIKLFITRSMQNPAIKTLKAIREIHNEPHQQQVHMGGWLSEMTQTTLLHDSLGLCCPLASLPPLPPLWCSLMPAGFKKLPFFVFLAPTRFTQQVSEALVVGLAWRVLVKHGVTVLTAACLLKGVQNRIS